MYAADLIRFVRQDLFQPALRPNFALPRRIILVCLITPHATGQ